MKGVDMIIAVIGKGRVGTALGEGWTKAGHRVIYGSRNAPNDGTVSIAEAATAAEMIVIATPWQAAQEVCATIGPQPGKIIIDCTNPVLMGGGAPKDATGHVLSGGEQVQGWRPEAAVFKTLNQTGFETLAHAHALSARPVMLVAGNDAALKPIVMQRVSELGLDAVDAGPLNNAGKLEDFAKLWVELAFKQGQGRGFAFARVMH
jgi:8-hydroxy-5-deazaflavin:NADPH oxidoreductase